MKRIANRLKVLLVVCWLCLASWAISGHAALAGDMKALVFNSTGGSVEVASIYETSYSAQKGVLKSLKPNIKAMKKAVGFEGASTLQSMNGKQAIALSQWQDLASYQAYTTTLTADSSKAENPKTTSVPPPPTRTVTFETVAAQTAIAGATPALRGKQAVVQWVYFTPKDPSTRSQLLAQVEATIPSILQKQPIPQSVVLLKGKDSQDVALLTNWNCSAMFEDVGKPAVIIPSSDLLALADVRQQLFKVANITPAEVKQKQEDKSA
jgi:heme-degrading monooxygenase HmoA